MKKYNICCNFFYFELSQTYTIVHRVKKVKTKEKNNGKKQKKKTMEKNKRKNNKTKIMKKTIEDN